MNVYQLQPDYEYRSVFAADPGQTDPFLWWTADTEPAEYEAWAPPAFKDESPSSESYSGEHPLGDLVDLSGHFALAPAAMREIGSLLGEHGVLLPILYRDMSLYWFHCTTKVDALDEARTIAPRFSSGKLMLPDRYAFRTEHLNEALVFRIPQFTKGPVFCSDSFKRLVEARGLKGLDFRLIWSDEPEGMARIMAREKANKQNLPPMRVL